MFAGRDRGGRRRRRGRAPRGSPPPPSPSAAAGRAPPGRRRWSPWRRGRRRPRAIAALAPPAAAPSSMPLVAVAPRDGGPRVRSAPASSSRQRGDSPSAAARARCATRMRGARRGVPRPGAARSSPESVAPLVELLKAGCDEERAAAAAALACQPSRHLARPRSLSRAAAEPELLGPGPGCRRGDGWATAPRAGCSSSRSTRRRRCAAPPSASLAGLGDRRVEPLLLQGARRRRSRGARPRRSSSWCSAVASARSTISGAAVAVRLASLPRDPRARPAPRRPRRAEAGGTLPGVPAARAARDHRRAGAHRRARRARLPAGAPVGAEPRAAARRGARAGEPGADAEDLPQLASLASDDDWNVRNEAARGLARLPARGDAGRCCSPWRATSSRWWRSPRARRSPGHRQGRGPCPHDPGARSRVEAPHRPHRGALRALVHRRAPRHPGLAADARASRRCSAAIPLEYYYHLKSHPGARSRARPARR